MLREMSHRSHTGSAVNMKRSQMDRSVYFLIVDNNKAFSSARRLSNVPSADRKPTRPQVSPDEGGQTRPRLQTEKVNKTSGWIPSRQEWQTFVSSSPVFFSIGVFSTEFLGFATVSQCTLNGT